jgi:hypothetical protein
MTHLQTLRDELAEAERRYDREVKRIGEPFQQLDPYGSTLHPLYLAVCVAEAALQTELNRLRPIG